MRPQRNAGENEKKKSLDLYLEDQASMRPQRNAGENPPLQQSMFHTKRASMRPQRNAGENEHEENSKGIVPGGFNEAPAKCRGKRSTSW